jgi:hypothetical protein
MTHIQLRGRWVAGAMMAVKSMQVLQIDNMPGLNETQGMIIGNVNRNSGVDRIVGEHMLKVGLVN